LANSRPPFPDENSSFANSRLFFKTM
jgi:hypothetical protein